MLSNKDRIVTLTPISASWNICHIVQGDDSSSGGSGSSHLQAEQLLTGQQDSQLGPGTSVSEHTESSPCEEVKYAMFLLFSRIQIHWSGSFDPDPGFYDK